MKTTILIAMLSLTIAAPMLADDNALSTNKNARLSYALGMMWGGGLKARDATNIDYDMVLRGLSDAESGGATLMTMQEMRDTLNRFQQETAWRAEEKRRTLEAKNQKIGQAFLAKNINAKGVVGLPDGLQYKVIADGSGDSPTNNNDSVVVSYEGSLIDGKVVEKSDKARFQMSAVIEGLREALTRMKVGSQWELFIPASLAYGPYGRPPTVEPGSVLIYDVHLLSVDHPQPLTSDIIKVPSEEEIKNGAHIEVLKPEDVKKLQEQSGK